MTYQPKVYREQGGDTLKVASGGDINVEAGGTVTNAGAITNTGTITQSGDLNNSGDLTNSGGITNTPAGMSRDSVATPAVGSTIPYHGVSIVGTSSGATAYTLAKPGQTGTLKAIVGSTHMGANAATVTATAGLTIGTTQAAIAINEAGGAIHLIGVTTTRWGIVGMSTGASVS